MHSAPENLCTQTPPLNLSLSQIIELEEKEDEAKLFTKTDKKQCIKTTFLSCQKAYCLQKKKSI